MNAQIRQTYEGLLHKYTNAMKGWQYRWFILSPETGELHYFLSESEKNQRPRCSIYLAGAVIAPSDEDSNTFTVNSATGDMIKLRATDARARQEWVDKLRAVTEMYTRAIASSHPPLPPREHCTNTNRTPVAKLEVLDAFANCREQLNKVEKQNHALARTIENSSLYLDPDLLVLKATAHATLHTLNQCLNILYQPRRAFFYFSFSAILYECQVHGTSRIYLGEGERLLQRRAAAGPRALPSGVHGINRSFSYIQFVLPQSIVLKIIREKCAVIIRARHLLRPTTRRRLLAEAAGVKVVMTAPEIIDQDVSIVASQAWRRSLVLKIDNPQNNNTKKKKFLGFHLSRSKWDPYPWVGYVEAGSIADLAGLRAGDCLLDIEGTDLVGLGVKEIASLIRIESGNFVRLEVWRSSFNPAEEDGRALAGPLPEVAKRLANAISGTVRALECPVCLESASSPVSQCVHGHILCVGCRAKTPRCPICRVRLGQGRCLLADQVHRYIREAFDETRHDFSSGNLSLREKLFGRSNTINSNKNPDTSSTLDDRHGISGSANSRISSIKLKSSITRLFLGAGFDKAASAENLSVATGLVDENHRTLDGRPAAYRRLGELSQNDRTKSASTGELSKDNGASIHRRGTNRVYTSASGLLSVPQTPTWGGSTESINNSSFVCPLSRWTNCNELVSTNFVLEHLARSHDGAQVYFNGRIATIPLPLPFGPESSYILRHRGEVFFFQYEKEEAWVAGSGTENLGQWSLVGKNNDGTEVKLRRLVARLEDASAPLPCHMAHLPKALGIYSVVIELIDSRLDQQLQV